jgi:hypothetical protein
MHGAARRLLWSAAAPAHARPDGALADRPKRRRIRGTCGLPLAWGKRPPQSWFPRKARGVRPYGPTCLSCSGGATYCWLTRGSSSSSSSCMVRHSASNRSGGGARPDRTRTRSPRPAHPPGVDRPTELRIRARPRAQAWRLPRLRDRSRTAAPALPTRALARVVADFAAAWTTSGRAGRHSSFEGNSDGGVRPAWKAVLFAGKRAAPGWGGTWRGLHAQRARPRVARQRCAPDPAGSTMTLIGRSRLGRSGCRFP